LIAFRAAAIADGARPSCTRLFSTESGTRTSEHTTPVSTPEIGATSCGATAAAFKAPDAAS